MAMTLPPSAITVLGLLAIRGPLTHKAIVEAAPIPARTVRFALSRLVSEGRVLERPSFRDSRQSYYLLATGDVATLDALRPPAVRNELRTEASLAAS